MLFRSLRYVLPSFALVSAALVLAFSGADRGLNAAGVVAGGLLVLLNTGFIQSATYYGQLRPQVLLSNDARARYLTDNLPTRKVVEIVNRLNPGGSPVAVFGSPLTAGLKSDALYASWYNLKWFNKYNASHQEGALAALLRRENVEWLIIDTAQLTPERLQTLMAVSLPVATVNGVALRRFDYIDQPLSELLKNSDLATSAGWGLTDPASYDAAQKTLTVNVKTPATQAVGVEAGQTYKVVVSVRCATLPTDGRAQVNWQDANGMFVKADITTYPCTDDWVTHEMSVTAPEEAVTAIIYASGHTLIPLAFKSVSFKQ